MNRHLLLFALACVGAASATSAQSATMDAMRWHRRVLLIATPNAQDPRAVAQQRILDGWKMQAASRDISLVEIAGPRVDGADETAAALRARYRLRPDAFAVLLIGKDGTVALRSGQPVRATTLQGTIDAMPMRRNGGR